MEILLAAESLLKSIEIVSRLVGSRTSSRAEIIELRERVQTLREQALTLRESAATLLEENQRLQRQLGQRRDESEKVHKLVEKRFPNGAVVLVRGVENDSPDQADAQSHQHEHQGHQPHGQPYYCPQCAKHGQANALQPNEQQWHHDVYACPECGLAVRVPNGREALAESVRTPGRWDDF